MLRISMETEETAPAEPDHHLLDDELDEAELLAVVAQIDRLSASASNQKPASVAAAAQPSSLYEELIRYQEEHGVTGNEGDTNDTKPPQNERGTSGTQSSEDDRKPAADPVGIFRQPFARNYFANKTSNVRGSSGEVSASGESTNDAAEEAQRDGETSMGEELSNAQDQSQTATPEEPQPSVPNRPTANLPEPDLEEATRNTGRVRVIPKQPTVPNQRVAPVVRVAVPQETIAIQIPEVDKDEELARQLHEELNREAINRRSWPSSHHESLNEEEEALLRQLSDMPPDANSGNDAPRRHSDIASQQSVCTDAEVERQKEILERFQREKERREMQEALKLSRRQTHHMNEDKIVEDWSKLRKTQRWRTENPSLLREDTEQGRTRRRQPRHNDNSTNSFSEVPSSTSSSSHGHLANYHRRQHPHEHDRDCHRQYQPMDASLGESDGPSQSYNGGQGTFGLDHGGRSLRGNRRGQEDEADWPVSGHDRRPIDREQRPLYPIRAEDVNQRGPRPSRPNGVDPRGLNDPNGELNQYRRGPPRIGNDNDGYGEHHRQHALREVLDSAHPRRSQLSRYRESGVIDSGERRPGPDTQPDHNQYHGHYYYHDRAGTHQVTNRGPHRSRLHSPPAPPTTDGGTRQSRPHSPPHYGSRDPDEQYDRLRPHDTNDCAYEDPYQPNRRPRSYDRDDFYDDDHRTCNRDRGMYREQQGCHDNPLPRGRPTGRPDYNPRPPGGDELPRSLSAPHRRHDAREPAIRQATSVAGHDLRSRRDGDDMDVSGREGILTRGQRETELAVRSGVARIVRCQGCRAKLQAPVHYNLVYCPTCGMVSPCSM